MKNKIIGVCPNCGANVVEREKGWFCENRECRALRSGKTTPTSKRLRQP